jgi:hypothetical protein
MRLGVVGGSICFACCGFALAGLMTSPESAGPIVQVILLPLQLISGVYFPTAGLPDWLHAVASIFPLVHITQAFQHAMLPDPSIPWGDLRGHGDLGGRHRPHRGADLQVAPEPLTINWGRCGSS